MPCTSSDLLVPQPGVEGGPLGLPAVQRLRDGLADELRHALGSESPWIRSIVLWSRRTGVFTVGAVALSGGRPVARGQAKADGDAITGIARRRRNLALLRSTSRLDHDPSITIEPSAVAMRSLGPTAPHAMCEAFDDRS